MSKKKLAVFTDTRVFRGALKRHTVSIERKTGADIRQAYYDLALDTSYTFSSLEPSAAIVLIKKLDNKKTFQFAHLVQDAIFKEGKRLDKYATYEPILTELHINKTQFKNRWMTPTNIQNTKDEFVRANKISYGFPSLFLSKNGKTNVIAAGEFDPKDITKILDKEFK